LRDLLPAFSDGTLIEKPFVPQVTDLGQRHPVTRGLARGGDPAQWGAWTRQVSTGTVSGQTIMSGADGLPLLVLRHEGDGRVALLLSDQIWLWARHVQGGGPSTDLLRRLAHWLMKEPDLQEEALRAKADGRSLSIERQTLSDGPHRVTVTAPNGQEQSVALSEFEPGLYGATVEADQTGVWRISEGELQTVTLMGSANPREFQNVISSEDRLKDLTAASRGSTRRLATAKGDLQIPSIVMVKSGSVFSGDTYMALRDTESERPTGLSLWPIFAGFSGLLMVLSVVIASWLGETGWRRFKRPTDSSSP
jgi:hypothetical protein